ncbi:hypothetical protein L2E82_47212 [Cichorium intybus]|uniref:Uncharacterized protein n=1 Tax=Cichorium intybus TaxID=13427 RepID=A0ACB8YWC5_CICIN|nr:hypothetical protein L2E82_47212 [Cichorium intybus]
MRTEVRKEENGISHHRCCEQGNSHVSGICFPLSHVSGTCFPLSRNQDDGDEKRTGIYGVTGTCGGSRRWTRENALIKREREREERQCILIMLVSTDNVEEIAIEISQWPKASGTYKRITVITQGDAFVGGFLSQLVKEKPIEEYVRIDESSNGDDDDAWSDGDDVGLNTDR